MALSIGVWIYDDACNGGNIRASRSVATAETEQATFTSPVNINIKGAELD